MSSRLTEIIIESRDPDELAAFWCAVLGFTVIERRHEWVEIASWVPTVEAVRAGQGAPTLVFNRVPEDKGGKNRLHLDVSPIDGSLEEEVERLIALGARKADIGQDRADVDWEVMVDPEGNEFCVASSVAPGYV